MRSAVGLALVFSLSAVAAGAAEAPSLIKPAIGNTVVVTYSDGRTQRLWLEPDGQWTGASRGGKPRAGRWRISANQLCLRQTQPPTLPISFCTPVPKELRIGLQWKARTLKGERVDMSLVEGVVSAPARARATSPDSDEG